MRGPVSYDKKVRERAKTERKALFCIEINRQYCEHLPDNERNSWSMQGPADDAKAAEVSRLLLRFNGVSEEKIDELYPKPAALAASPEPALQAGADTEVDNG